MTPMASALSVLALLAAVFPARGTAAAEFQLAYAIALLNFLFRDGPPPRAPFPDCGLDPTPDNLACALPPPCE